MHIELVKRISTGQYFSDNELIAQDVKDMESRLLNALGVIEEELKTVAGRCAARDKLCSSAVKSVRVKSADEVTKLFGTGSKLPEHLKPKVVCLCGSTRFYQEFQKANFEQTMEGHIVLSVGFYPHSSEQVHGENIGITPEKKLELDALHKRKIDLADEVLVLNIGGYIGDSTRSEIEYSYAHNKKVLYKEEPSTDLVRDMRNLNKEEN